MTDITLSKFTAEERAVLERLDLQRLPRHIAIIMDGNGRWASRQQLPRIVGHRAGVESVRAVVTACGNLGIEYLTLYSFSTENWARPDDEVSGLMQLIEHQLNTETEGLHAQGMRIRHLGRSEELPDGLRQAIKRATIRTLRNPGLQVIFAINYSGRAELTDAVRRLADRAASGQCDATAITEDTLAGELYLPDVPVPDLLIRTGGELRISNFLLWQLAYTELWFTPLLWPEFRAMDLCGALEEYQQRQRKFGRIAP